MLWCAQYASDRSPERYGQSRRFGLSRLTVTEIVGCLRAATAIASSCNFDRLAFSVIYDHHSVCPFYKAKVPILHSQQMLPRES